MALTSTKPTTSSKPAISRLRFLAEFVCGFTYPRHWQEWERIALTCQRAMVLGSRDHAKTTFFSVLYALFRAIQNGWEVVVFSYAEDQAKEIVSKIKELVDTKSLLFDRKPPNSEATWSKTDIHFTIKGRISAFGFGSSVRGRHPNLIIIDDPTKDFGGMNDDDQFRFYTNVIVPMCTPTTQLLIVSNRVRDGDLVDRLESEGIHKPMLFPAIVDGRPLWPERWSLEDLDKRRQEIGDFAFGREYLLKKISPHSTFFDKMTLRFYEEAPQRLAKIMSVDPAITTTGDFTAVVVTGTSEENKTYCLDYANLKTDNIQKILDRIMDLAMLHRVNYLKMESIGFQRLLRHWLDEEMRKRNYFFGVEEIKAYNKNKQARIMALQPRIQSGSLLFRQDQTEMIQQLLAFPHGKHDDLIDALCMQVGSWDKPPEISQEAPDGSFAWWMKQGQDQDYRTDLFADLTGNAD